MESFAEKRLQVCSTCPLFRKQWDGNHRCDSSKYMKPETKETSYLPKKGFVRGCSCIIEYKVRQPNAKCVAGLWPE